VALSKWWSHASDAALDCTVTFRGLLPASRLVSMVCLFLTASIIFILVLFVAVVMLLLQISQKIEVRS